MESDTNLPGLFGPFGTAVKSCTAAPQLLPIGDNCKQYPGKMVNGYPISYNLIYTVYDYNVMLHQVFYIYGLHCVL